MTVDGRALGAVPIDTETRLGSLSAAQVQALLSAVLKDGRLAWTAQGKTWTISAAGANAVLLKMDDFHGRVGTPGALVRKGGRPESGVLPALPLPVVVAAPVPARNPQEHLLDARAERALLAALHQASRDECTDLEDPDDAEPGLLFHRLSGDKLLVTHACWHGASSTGEGYWVVNARPPYAPVLVTSAGTRYANGTLESSGGPGGPRGAADCTSRSTWTWDGQAFVQTLCDHGGMCRGVAAGGAWPLPTLVTEVRRP